MEKRVLKKTDKPSFTFGPLKAIYAIRPESGLDEVTVEFQNIALTHLLAKIWQKCNVPGWNAGGMVWWGFNQELGLVLGGKRKAPGVTQER